MDNKINVAVDIIVEKNNKVLMGKRLNATGAGFYGVPGGHLEFGESITLGAKRELEEETGINTGDMALISIIDQPGTVTPQHYIHFLFKCSNFTQEPVNKEPNKCEGWEWFEINKLPDNIFISHANFVPSYLSKKLLIE